MWKKPTAGETHLTPGLERAPLWPQENILEVQLDVILNARHYGNKTYWGKTEKDEFGPKEDKNGIFFKSKLY